MLLIIILSFPTLFQIIIGNKTKTKSIQYPYEKVCLISYILQVISLIISFSILTYGDNRSCGAVIAGLLMLNILMIVIITAVIIAQHFRYKY